MAGLPRALRPLRHPAYRLLAVSLGLSLLANGSWAIAVVWQVVALGGGPAEVSLVSGLTAGGTLAVALLGGVLADRVPQRHILLVVALLQAVPVAGVAVLSLSDGLPLSVLAGVGLLGGVGMGLYYPAYSALVPALLPEDELLAANGLEGMMRPLLHQVAGPVAAGLLVEAASPGVALLVTAAAAAGAALCVAAVPVTRVRREPAAVPTHPLRAMAADLREGFAYMVRTPWLLATLLFASLMLLVMLGPFEVLAPFAIRDRAGGGPADHALVLTAFGVGGALGSLLISSRPLPRRYLTVMNLLWGLGCLPLAVFGLTSQLWVMVAACLLTGATFQAGMVIWGTLLQRRVPPALLGRVSSLDFLVSGAFLPLSVALAGPVSEWIGLTATFLVAGLVPVVLAVVTIVAARMPADEVAHPLDRGPDAERVGSPA
ncbi:MFS transporter [Geodermatophilus sp. DSM 45219]|uniref:MFS transporter n=1 Tax=Geodermatophilus sp. DSM 45219 TaxID=1881103 RepID=UPI000880A055|nr:MFS transporter [Geodermatophilus sp. DSM 45219]SDN99651.1 Predicted arabinose efflux permease, MFS family [Geodermatophilus sp. DSM 45219]